MVAHRHTTENCLGGVSADYHESMASMRRLKRMIS
jgi:hypothetical protein